MRVLLKQSVQPIQNTTSTGSKLKWVYESFYKSGISKACVITNIKSLLICQYLICNNVKRSCVQEIRCLDHFQTFFFAAHILIKQIRNRIVDFSKNTAIVKSNISLIREDVATILYIIQEFYSNTNYIELFGNNTIYEDFGNSYNLIIYLILVIMMK